MVTPINNNRCSLIQSASVCLVCIVFYSFSEVQDAQNGKVAICTDIVKASNFNQPIDYFPFLLK